VLSAFSFLSTDYSFTCVTVEDTFVRYESESIFINIYHGRSSYELGVEIGKLEKNSGLPEDWYTIGEIMDLIGVREKLKFTFFQASTRDRIQMLVPKLAEYVREYAKPILNGDIQLFDKLHDLRQRKSDSYLKDMKLRRIREKAEIAWHEKNYSELIALYKSMRDDLSQVEAKKLEYAQKRLQSG
jgi:hypothetical protein